MKTFEFRVIVGGPAVEHAIADEDAFDALSVRLYEAGCDDGTFGVSGGEASIDFDREAESLGHAVLSAVDDLRSVQGVRVERVTPDAELVSMAEIARRVGVSRESVRLYVQGERGPGGFPWPIARLGKQKLWRWLDVAVWFTNHADAEDERAEWNERTNQARLLVAVNAAIALSNSNPTEARRVLHAVAPELARS